MKKKIAFVSDQLASGIAGSEMVLLQAHEQFQDSPIYTTVFKKSIFKEKYSHINVISSFLQKFPFAISKYKAYFPLMPLAIELHNLQEYDIIFSSHHSVAKGVIPRPDAVHICYCHSPARYIWDLFWTYTDMNGCNNFKRLIVGAISQYIRTWDVISSNRVDLFLANSSFTAKRIKKYYRREAEIVYPPVNTKKFNYEDSKDYYLMAGRLVAYKGFELAVNAFNESGKKLVIIGNGPEYNKLKKLANKNIEFLGKVDDAQLVHHMNNCKGFIFPGKEDFGIVMAEAQAAGKPVIALNQGGAIDIVIDNETGVLFDEPTVESLNIAIFKSEKIKWNPNKIMDHSKQFDTSVFNERIKYFIDNACLYTSNTDYVIR